MEPKLRKTSSTTRSTCDTPSPVLLRRRLSTPETVMRKYKLAKARAQEDDLGQTNDSKFGEMSLYGTYSGSDLNLQKKKDSSVVMRKSTLLKRLMNNPKTLCGSSFQEWQHYCGKLSTPSLNSLQGSPEHMSKSYSRRSLVGYEFKTSPKHIINSRKVSPIRQVYETHKHSLSQTITTSPKRMVDIPGEHKSICKVPMSSQQRNPVEVSDSAYSNDRSNFSSASISSNSSIINVKSQQSLKKIEETTSKNTGRRIVDENRNFPVNTSYNYVTQESSTQTSSSTNLNVISNVQLSQQTLDLIVNEVMKDVQKICTNGNEIKDDTGDSMHVGVKQNKPFGITKIKR